MTWYVRMYNVCVNMCVTMCGFVYVCVFMSVCVYTVVWKYFVGKKFSWMMLSTKINHTKIFSHEEI